MVNKGGCGEGALVQDLKLRYVKGILFGSDNLLPGSIKHLKFPKSSLRKIPGSASGTML